MAVMNAAKTNTFSRMPNDKIEEISALLPGMKSPTVPVSQIVADKFATA
jgi:ATP phosphoribosyltransferase